MKKQADHAKDNTDSWSAFLIKAIKMETRTIKTKQRGFTLVEILIVVVLLGILATTVISMASGSALSAKESALATDLSLLRRFILIYKCQHLEVSPGYPDGVTTVAPTEAAFVNQATLSSNSSGVTMPIGTAGFERGPYMQKLPANPMNSLSSVQMLGDGADFPAAADNSHGWICKPSTSEIRADSTGDDSNGKSYYDY
ncbi:type II secretion system protein [Planctomycetota bacterium]